MSSPPLNLREGSRVRIRTKTGLEVEGVVLPRYSIYGYDHVTLKLDNGYNVGIRLDNIESLEVVEERRARREAIVLRLEEEAPEASPTSRVRILLTGGTIASKIDYETGGVTPIMSSEELLEAVPELGSIASIEVEYVMGILSEEMTPRHWEEIARRVARALEEDGERGVVVAHGTDTMAYTAAALSFALRNLPAPVALVGSQRSSDRPSSDSAFNLVAAALYATSDIGEVAVVMHGGISDAYALAHRGTRVRKMHTSRRDAFQSISSLPLARVLPYERRVELLRSDARRRAMEGLEVMPRFSDRVALVKFYPGMTGEVLDFLVDRGYRGIVLEGTGLGHVSLRLLDSIKRGVEQGVVFAMTSQCIFGEVNMNVYSTGRRLLEAGVLPSYDMLPETAYVKLSWLVANFDDPATVRKFYLKNLAGEFETRRTVNLFPRWDYGV